MRQPGASEFALPSSRNGHDSAGCLRHDGRVRHDTTITDGEGAQSALLFGRVLDGKGGGREISWDEARAWQPAHPAEVLWVHLLRNAPGVSDWLGAQGLALPAPTAALLTSEDTRPRAFREGNALVATLRGINFNPGAAPEDMVSMQLWSDGVRVVTLRRRPLQTPRDTLADIDEGAGPGDAGALVNSLVDYMISRMNRLIVDINEQIDRLEDEDDDGATERRMDVISRIRRDCLALKRHMSPQHEALEKIARDAPDWFRDHDRRAIAEDIARLGRYLADLDISKESALLLQDELRTRALAGSQRTSYLLSIVAAIFLPLSFLTGLLGINVGGMPGAEQEQAFWIVAGICLAIVLVELVLFRRWKWF